MWSNMYKKLFTSIISRCITMRYIMKYTFCIIPISYNSGWNF
jgi:hypothetical protein